MHGVRVLRLLTIAIGLSLAGSVVDAAARPRPRPQAPAATPAPARTDRAGQAGGRARRGGSPATPSRAW